MYVLQIILWFKNKNKNKNEDLMFFIMLPNFFPTEQMN